MGLPTHTFPLSAKDALFSKPTSLTLTTCYQRVCTNEYQEIPLVEAANEGRYDIVLILLEAGADYNRRAFEGVSLLIDINRTDPSIWEKSDPERQRQLAKVKQWLIDRKALN